MPNPTVSRIRSSNNTLYDIVDQGARDLIEALGSPTHYLGELSPSDTHYEDFVDGCSYNPVLVKEGAGTKSVTAESGDILSKVGAEFIFDGTTWNEFGDLSNLGNFAHANYGTVTIKPKGTNASSSVTFGSHTKDNCLGEATTFSNSPSAVTFGTPTTDSVLGADTQISASSSSVTFGTHTKATVLKSDVTATVPKPSYMTRYMELNTSKLDLTSAATVSAAGTAGSAASFSATVTDGVLSFSFTPNTPTALPIFGSVSVAAGTVSANGGGASVGTGLTEQSDTGTGRVQYVKSASTSGTNSVTFATSGHTADAITALGAATAAAQAISVGDNDIVSAITDMPTATADAQAISVGTNDKVAAITALGAATAAAQKFTGTEETYQVTPVIP